MPTVPREGTGATAGTTTTGTAVDCKNQLLPTLCKV